MVKLTKGSIRNTFSVLPRRNRAVGDVALFPDVQKLPRLPGGVVLGRVLGVKGAMGLEVTARISAAVRKRKGPGLVVLNCRPLEDAGKGGTHSFSGRLAVLPTTSRCVISCSRTRAPTENRLNL